jgi:AcrR family transcriptional regulator
MSGKQPLTKRQVRAAATGEQLLAAARETFETRGYAHTSIGAITKAANTAHGTFYLHFMNKEDAFARVMASVMEEMYLRTTPAEHAAEPADTVRASVRGYLEVFIAHRGLWRCLLEGMLQHPSIERMWLELRVPFADRIVRAMSRAREAGRAREDVDYERAALALCSMCEWYAFTNFNLHGPGVIDDLDTVVGTLSDLWYHAMYVDPA